MTVESLRSKLAAGAGKRTHRWLGLFPSNRSLAACGFLLLPMAGFDPRVSRVGAKSLRYERD